MFLQDIIALPMILLFFVNYVVVSKWGGEG